MPKASALEPKVRCRRALLKWFRRQARSLPWRRTRDPYTVWVSEVMLQQTQIATVIPYYQRFLQTFPSFEQLARAPLERVLEVWSGMGYYRRARNLHEAAKAIVQNFGGCFPRDYEEARTLPGVGDYTAKAVLSIAYDQPFAVLDGNVARVVARLAALRGNLHQPGFRRAIEKELEQLLSRRQPGNFNQAVMELGQTVCLPRSPQCPACPIRTWCRAFALGKAENFPEPRPRRATEAHFLAAAFLRRGNRVGMVRGLDDGLLGDLWNFPSAFGASRSVALSRLREKLAAFSVDASVADEPCAELRHGITFRNIRIYVHPATLGKKFEKNGMWWVPLSRLAGSAVSQLARKIAQEVQ